MKIEQGKLYKHYKGKDLMQKNIYMIVSTGNMGCDVNYDIFTYTGEGDPTLVTDMVCYTNVFQTNAYFCRSERDLVKVLPPEKQFGESRQRHVIEPLTDYETSYVASADFRNAKVLVEEGKRLIIEQKKAIKQATK